MKTQRRNRKWSGTRGETDDSAQECNFKKKLCWESSLCAEESYCWLFPSGTQDLIHFYISPSHGRRLLPGPKGESASPKYSTPATLPRAQSQPRHLLMAQATLLLSSFQFPVVDPLLLHGRCRLFLWLRNGPSFTIIRGWSRFISVMSRGGYFWVCIPFVLRWSQHKF